MFNRCRLLPRSKPPNYYEAQHRNRTATGTGFPDVFPQQRADRRRLDRRLGAIGASGDAGRAAEGGIPWVLAFGRTLRAWLSAVRRAVRAAGGRT